MTYITVTAREAIECEFLLPFWRQKLSQGGQQLSGRSRGARKIRAFRAARTINHGRRPAVSVKLQELAEKINRLPKSDRTWPLAFLTNARRAESIPEWSWRAKALHKEVISLSMPKFGYDYPDHGSVQSVLGFDEGYALVEIAPYYEDGSHSERVAIVVPAPRNAREAFSMAYRHARREASGYGLAPWREEHPVTIGAWFSKLGYCPVGTRVHFCREAETAMRMRNASAPLPSVEVMARLRMVRTEIAAGKAVGNEHWKDDRNRFSAIVGTHLGAVSDSRGRPFETGFTAGYATGFVVRKDGENFVGSYEYIKNSSGYPAGHHKRVATSNGRQFLKAAKVLGLR